MVITRALGWKALAERIRWVERWLERGRGRLRQGSRSEFSPSASRTRRYAPATHTPRKRTRRWPPAVRASDTLSALVPRYFRRGLAVARRAEALAWSRRRDDGKRPSLRCTCSRFVTGSSRTRGRGQIGRRHYAARRPDLQRGAPPSGEPPRPQPLKAPGSAHSGTSLEQRPGRRRRIPELFGDFDTVKNSCTRCRALTRGEAALHLCCTRRFRSTALGVRALARYQRGRSPTCSVPQSRPDRQLVSLNAVANLG